MLLLLKHKIVKASRCCCCYNRKLVKLEDAVVVKTQNDKARVETFSKSHWLLKYKIGKTRVDIFS